MDIRTVSIIYFVIFIASMVLIAVFAARQKNASGSDAAKEQFLGGNKIPFAVLAVSYAASFASSGSFMGDPAVISVDGYSYLWMMVGCLSGVMIMTALVVRKMRIQCEKLGVMSPVEYVSARFDSKFLRALMGLICAGCFFVSLIAQFRAASILLEHFIGIQTDIGVMIVGAVVLLCTVIGGLRSVAWTDAIQGVVMAVMTVILFVVGIIEAGGIENLHNTFANIDPEMVQLAQDDMWGDWGPLGAIGIVVFGLLVMPAQPYLTSRYMAIKGLTRKAIAQFALVLTVFAAIFGLNNFAGVTGRVLFPDAAADYIVVTLATGILPVALSCLIMIGLFSAILTTSTSMLLIVGQSIGRDFMVVVKPELSTGSQVKISNITCLAVVGLAVFFNITNTPELLTLLNLIGMTGVGASLAMPLYMGVLHKNATKEAAIASCVVGIGSTILFNLIVESVGYGVIYGAPPLCAVLAYLIVNPIILKTKGLDPHIAKLGSVEL